MATPSSKTSFGARLRETRERRGVTLRQIADDTKISVRALEALERDDISKLPGGIFTRSFVRAYAVKVGLDPEQTIHEFIEQFPQDSVTVGHPTSHSAEDPDAFEGNRLAASAFVKLLAVSVPIAILLFYFGFRQGGSSSPSSTQPAVSESLPAPAASAPEPRSSAPPSPVDGPSNGTAARATGSDAGPAATAGKAALSDAPLVIGLSTRTSSWVSVRVDGDTAIQRELSAGERHTFDVRHDFVITTGNAGALTLTLNGAEAKPLGKEGQVVTTRLNLKNFKNYIAAQ